MRSLSPEEAELWQRVTVSIRPLSRDIPERSPVADRPAPAPELASPISPKAFGPKKAGTRPVAPTPAPSPLRPRPGTLDGTWDRRLRNGTIEPDRILDLHGMSLDRAWEAIDRALERSIAAGDRVLLLITGHHRPGEPPIARGKIRAAVHDWLAVSRHASAIAAVRGAHRRHGGGGSLYLVLRRG